MHFFFYILALLFISSCALSKKQLPPQNSSSPQIKSPKPILVKKTTDSQPSKPIILPPPQSPPPSVQPLPISPPATIEQSTTPPSPTGLNLTPKTHLQITQLPCGAHFVQIDLSSLSPDAYIDVILFQNKTHTLEIIDQPNPWNSPRWITTLLDHPSTSAAINASYFTPLFQPLGLTLFQNNQKQRQSLGEWTHNSLISCTLYTQKDGVIHLTNDSKPQDHELITNLLQAGPRLLWNKQPLPSLDNSKTCKRSFIATDNRGLWMIGASSPATLLQLSQWLNSTLIPIPIHHAMNLDGGNSTSFCVKRPDSNFKVIGWSTVRNYITVKKL
jgi:hypothetical protein